MGVEVVGNDAAPGQVKVADGDDTSLPERDIQLNSTEQHIEEPIKPVIVNSSHEVNGETKEIDHLSASNFPKDALDEWPVPKQTHIFYFVRVRSYEDPKLKAKIDIADKEFQRINQDRFQIIEAIKSKRSERSHVISQLMPLASENKKYKTAIDEKLKEMEPLHAALSELQLNDLIQSLHYRMEHESNTLVAEKQLLKEIKQLEQTREKVIANAATRAKLQDSYGKKEDIQDHVKLIGGDMDGVRKEQQTIRSKIKHLDEEVKAIDAEIKSLEKDLNAVSDKKDNAYKTLKELIQGRGDVNMISNQNRSLLNHAKELAAKKDIAALEELSRSEVEKFMSKWNDSKAFRDDYERRILTSLDNRHLTRDGRMRNPDEKPNLQAVLSKESEAAPITVTAKRAKDWKAQDEVIIKSPEIELRGKSGNPVDIEYTLAVEKSTKPKEIDVAKLKEMKREEELAKSKLAMERKKKLAEKAATKAAARAQKEAEKKMKEKEKKAKKKAGVLESIAPDEQTETDTKTSEPEEADINLDAPVPANPKEQKERVRPRNRTRVPNHLPKVILKRKKLHSYWLWAAPAAILAIVVVMVWWYYIGIN